ncbi:MAG: acyltransferase family protein [Planctomycetota bacterium]
MTDDRTAPSGRSASARDLPLLDALRLLANFEVVYHHMQGGTLFGSAFGVPLFMTLMIALAVGSTREEPALTFGLRKATYLLTPWLRWSLIYGGLAVGLDVAAGRSATTSLSWPMLAIGGHLSLWFLPAAAALLFLVKPVQKLAHRGTPAVAGYSLAIAAAAYTLVSPELAALFPRDLPDQTWVRVSPALLWGAAIAQSVRARSSRGRSAILLVTAALALAAWAIRPETVRLEDPIPRFGVAVPLTCLGFGLRVQLPRWVRSVSTATFGIYLSHVLIAKGLTLVASPTSWPHWAHAWTVWLLSLAAVFLLRRIGLQWNELRVGRRA